MTPREIYASIERGWKKLKWVRYQYMDRASARFEPGINKWISNGAHFEPTCACAIGALMYDQKISAPKAERLLIENGLSPSTIMSINDRAPDLDTAKENLKEYLLS